VSFRAEERFLQNSLSEGAARMVGLVLAHLANERGQSWHGMASLMKKTRLSERGVQMGVKDLIRLGDIAVYRGAGDKGTNVYQVLCFGMATNLELSQALTPPANDDAQSAPPHVVRGAKGMSPSAPEYKGTDNKELTLGADGGVEVPSEEEVLTEGKTYAGNLALGSPAGMPEKWCRGWYAGKLGYRQFNWERWRQIMKLDFERDFAERRPQAWGEFLKNPAAAGREDLAELREQLRVARHLEDDHEIQRLTALMGGAG
jgi:hypothetical protein